MSTISKEPKKVAAKNIKDNFNSVLKNATNPKERISKGKTSKLKKQESVDAKEILVSFYDKLIKDSNKASTSGRRQIKSTPVDDTPCAPSKIKSKESKIVPKKTNKSNNLDFDIPCTNDLCAKVRQLVEMNTQVQRFKKKFLEPAVLDNIEKKTLHHKKIMTGNQFSKRNLSSFKKDSTKAVKIKEDLEEDQYSLPRVKNVGWNPQTLIMPEMLGSSSTESLAAKRVELSYPSFEAFIDCYENETLYSARSIYSSHEGSVIVSEDCGKNPGDSSEYTTCTDDSNKKTIPSKSNEPTVHKSSSAKMLRHFKELLNQHTLRKNSEGDKSAVLNDDDVLFLKNLVEADQRYQYLKQEDHELLKEILKSQLKQIESQERILGQALKKLRKRTISTETVVLEKENYEVAPHCSFDSKENAEQPLECLCRTTRNALGEKSTDRSIGKVTFLTPRHLEIDLWQPKVVEEASGVETVSLEAITKLLGLPGHASISTSSNKSCETPQMFDGKLCWENCGGVMEELATNPSSNKSCETPQMFDGKLYWENCGGVMEELATNPVLNVPHKSDIIFLNQKYPSGLTPEPSNLCTYDTDEVQTVVNPPTKEALRVTSKPELANLDSLNENCVDKTITFPAVVPPLDLHDPNLEASYTSITADRIQKAYSERASVPKSPNPGIQVIFKNIDSPQKELKFLKAISARLEKTFEIAQTSFDGCQNFGVNLKEATEKTALAVISSELYPELKADVRIDELISNISDRISGHEECIMDRSTSPEKDVEESGEKREKSQFDANLEESSLKATELNLEENDCMSAKSEEKSFTRECSSPTEDITDLSPPIEFITAKIENFAFSEEYASVLVQPFHIYNETCPVKVFRVKYLSLDEMKNAGEFYIFHSKLGTVEPEKTNFEKLQANPEDLAKILIANDRELDSTVEAAEDPVQCTQPYPWQGNIFNNPDEVIMKNVICCFFKTWATYPELYNRAISPLPSFSNTPKMIEDVNQHYGIENSECLHRKTEQLDDRSEREPGLQSEESVSVNNIKQEEENNGESPAPCEVCKCLPSAIEDQHDMPAKISPNECSLMGAKKKNVKNVLVLFAQFVLFVLLVLGLSMPDFICLTHNKCDKN